MSVMCRSRKPRDGGGSGTPGDSPGTHRELVPRASRQVGESRGRADPGQPPGVGESRGRARPGACVTLDVVRCVWTALLGTSQAAPG